MKNTWGNGVLYDKEQTDELLKGQNQFWYSFKSSLLNHFGCNPSRGGGQFHYKSKQFENSVKKNNQAILSANVKVVGTALQVCKMKAAALHFESMLGYLSFCGVDVGNIGHGR